jgi:hypothetical protein
MKVRRRMASLMGKVSNPIKMEIITRDSLWTAKEKVLESSTGRKPSASTMGLGKTIVKMVTVSKHGVMVTDLKALFWTAKELV